MFKQKKERRVGPWGMGSTSQQNPQLQTLIEIISISHWQDPQLWQRGSARGGHCDRLCPWLQTSLSNVAGESSQNRSHKSCFCYTAWSFSLSAIALEFSISLFPETEAGTWHLVRKMPAVQVTKKTREECFQLGLANFLPEGAKPTMWKHPELNGVHVHNPLWSCVPAWAVLEMWTHSRWFACAHEEKEKGGLELTFPGIPKLTCQQESPSCS